MSKPYLVLSDLHCHNWSAFSTTLPNGMNSRLKIIVNEINRAVEELKKAGGNLVVIAGDLFHERGRINPEVFNPIFDCIERHQRAGILFDIIPGNHDLAGKETTELGNAVQTLAAMGNVTVFTKPTREAYDGDHPIAYVPWCGTMKGLRAAVESTKAGLSDEELARTDLIIHAGINGVLMGIPDHGLDAADVASWGFKRVFAGHYHNHKVMENGKVISIGATTHQTWSDLGTKAGFLIVDGDDVQFHASQAPSFVEINEQTDPDEVSLIVGGNYVRVRDLELTNAEMGDMRKDLLGEGALGVLIQTPVKAVQVRTGSAIVKSATLEQSVASYVTDQQIAHELLVQAACEDVLSAARSKAA